jgi:Uma2 family endonuclease
MDPEALANMAAFDIPIDVYPFVDHLTTEDDEPVDGVFSEKQQRLLTGSLYTSWPRIDPERKFIAMANVGFFSAINQPPLVPDVLLSVDVELPVDIHPKSHRSYFQWFYGKPPDVAIEVVSNKEGGEDGKKLVEYARKAVLYYAIFDPECLLSDQRLRLYRLDGRQYRMMDEPFWLADLKLGLRLWQGPFEGHEDTWLRWHDAKGELLLTGDEVASQERQRAEQERERAEQERNRAKQEHQRAEQERERAKQERERAKQERERAEKLAALVRNLGGNPDV